MSAIDRVRAHFRQFSGDGRSHVDVPEWGEETILDGKTVVTPLRIFFTPITGAEIRKARPKDGGETDFARLICIKAQDIKGEKLFDLMEDVPALSAQADWTVVTRIGLRMMVTPKLSDLEKN